MNTYVGSVIKMHLRDKWSWIYIPWMILGSSFLVNLLIASILSGESGMTTGGLISIFIYMFFAGLFALMQTFPFSLGFSVRRKDYLLGTGAVVVMISGVVAAALTLLSVIEHEVTGGWGVGLNFFYMPFLDEVNIVLLFLLYFVALIHLYAMGFSISSIHRRFGRNGMYVFGLASFLVVSVVVYLAHFWGLWMELYEWISGYSVVEIVVGATLAMAICSALYALVTYLFIRRASV